MLPQLNRQCIRANKKSNIIYLNNPKVGCSTIKFNLWNILAPGTVKPSDDVHDLERSPFTNTLAALDWAGDANIFSFVRNPFTRAVSAYLNKFQSHRDITAERFLAQHGLPAGKTLAFGEFIEIISSSPAEYLDVHWRPQHINLMYPFVRPNFLGFLEDMDAQLPLVLSRFVNSEIEQTRRKDAHRTKARALATEFFTDPAIKRMFVDQYYYDFEYFGYSPDVHAPETSRETPAFSEHSHAPLSALVAYRSADSPAARLAALKQIGGFDDILHDPFVKSWHLSGMLETPANPRKKRMAMIRESLGGILAGPDFLRRSAAGVAASAGEWSLCTRISAAGMR